MSQVDPQLSRRRFRLDALRWGIVAGAVLPIAIPLALIGLLNLSLPNVEAPQFNVDMSSVGADVTHNGGRRVIFANERGRVVQSCNGECDDVRLQESSGDNVYWFEVLDAQGRCVACSYGGYVTNGYGTEVTRLRVAGADVLDIRESYGGAPAVSRKLRNHGAVSPAAPR